MGRETSFAQTSVEGRVGRVPFRQFYDSVPECGGGRALALDGRYPYRRGRPNRQGEPLMSPRVIHIAADVRTNGGLAAVARFGRNFVVLLTGKARDR